MQTPSQCRCAICRNDLPISIPDHLIEELLKGNVVVFAGAGISTENRLHAQHTFYDQIAQELNCKVQKPFPQLMEDYCNRPDGRIRLIKAIKERFEYFCSFGAFYDNMTRFHRALSPLFMITEVITTNWDDFFERECGFDAFVSDSDMALWGASRRKLLKIHGSIRNLGSIVATEKDYKALARRLNDGPMGAQLKSLLTQKTLVYIGYSLSDSTFLSLAKRIAKMTYPNLRHSYFVSPEIDQHRIEQFPIPITPVQTDGAYFLEQLQLRIHGQAGLVPEHAFESCEDLLNILLMEHDEIARAFVDTKHPLLVFTLSYQDGLIHGLERINRLRKTGAYHHRCDVAHKIDVYETRAMEFRRKRDYWNSSYSDGYRDALTYLLLCCERPFDKGPPIYGEHNGVSFRSLASILRFPRKKVKRHYKAQADRMILSTTGSSEDLIPQHTPYL